MAMYMLQLDIHQLGGYYISTRYYCYLPNKRSKHVYPEFSKGGEPEIDRHCSSDCGAICLNVSLIFIYTHTRLFELC